MKEAIISRGHGGETVVELRTLSAEEIAALPAPPRRQLPKSVVTARLIDMDKMGPAHAALMADPIAYARWFTPDWPEVYADDAGLLSFLGAIGLTEEQISAVTA